MEEKTYSVVGTVTIGSDEYRDLIEQAVKAEARADACRSQYWSEQSEKKKLLEENEKLREKLARLSEFVNIDSIKDKYLLWVAHIKAGE